MAILRQVPAIERGPGRKYTHKGLLCGLCPVYIANKDTASPELTERNWVPAWFFHFTLAMFALAAAALELIDPTFDAEFPILVTGKLQ